MNVSLGEDEMAPPPARTVVPGAAKPVVLDDPDEVEFWDACWTLEDEWQPHPVVRTGSRPHRKHAKSPLTEYVAFL